MSNEVTPVDFHIYIDDQTVKPVLDKNDPQRTELMQVWADVFNRANRPREADECLHHGTKS